MFLIRSAEARDFKAVWRLAKLLDSYNLPAEPGFLRALLRDSERSFRGRRIPEGRKRFLIVAEDIRTKTVVGCSLILARHGTPKLPHVAFHVSRELKRSRKLKRAIEHQTLTLTVNRSGFTEIGGLVVLPRYRRREEHVGKQLSYARFALMAWQPRQFHPRLLVEYLPALDPKKGNMFWRVLGERFTHLSYRKADRESVRGKEFILSLFPKEKIYCGLLPKSAVETLGVPGPGARASLHTLERIGFRYLSQVDPFDGGPHYGALRRDISIVKSTRFLRYQNGVRPFGVRPLLVDRPRGLTPKGLTPFLVMSAARGKVRAAVSSCTIKRNWVRLPPEIASLLRLKPGARVSVTPLS